MTDSSNDRADEMPTFSALERLLLAGLQQGEDHTIAEAKEEALMLCQTAHTVHSAMQLQLKAALASIRSGRPDDAVGYIETAISIEEHWAARLTGAAG